jgi:parallel beta-helix repeat protein
LIGGASPGARNLVDGNVNGGIRVTGPAFGASRSANNRVLGNFIGVDATGLAGPYRVQTYGIIIDNGALTQVGGPGAGEGNTIAFNSRGVAVQNSVQNSIRGNRIFSNGSLAIDLNTNGVTPNDSGDADTGPNNLQNFPVLQTANITTGGTRMTGTLNSIANATYTIDFYSNDACDTLGNGEGQRYLGSGTVTTDATGNGSFTATISARASRGVATATATDANGNTSEFSACVPVGSEIPPQNFVVTNTSDSGAGSLRQAILNANDAFTTGRSTISFNIAGTTVQVIAPASQLPTVAAPIAIDGLTQPGSRPNSAAGVVDAILKVRLDGANAGAGADGLRITSSNVLVRGFIITRFEGAGIHAINANNVTISENMIGVTGPIPKTAQADSKKNNLAAGLGGFGNGVAVSANGGQGLVVQPDGPLGFGNIIGQNQVAGITLDQTQDTQIIDNDIEGNGIPGDPLSGGGIDSRGTVNLLSTQNTFSGNTPQDALFERSGTRSGSGLKHSQNQHVVNPPFINRLYNGVRVSQIAFAEINDNVISGIPGTGLLFDQTLSGGAQSVCGNRVTGCQGPPLFVNNSGFLNIGGSAADQVNVFRDCGSPPANRGGFGNFLAHNIFGANNTLINTLPPSEVPVIKVFRTVQGNNTFIHVTGHASPNQVVLLTFFGSQTDNTSPIPFLSPFGSGTVQAGPDGNFVDDLLVPAGIDPLMPLGSMASGPFGDTTEMGIANDPDGPGDVGFFLSGPSQVQPLARGDFQAMVQHYRLNSRNPLVRGTVLVPPNFSFIQSLRPLNDPFAPTFIQDNNTLFIEGYLPDLNPHFLNFTLQANSPGVFALNGHLTPQFGDNSNPWNDDPFFPGLIVDPLTGADILLGQPHVVNGAPVPNQMTVFDLPLFNEGTIPATGIQVAVDPSDGSVVIIRGDDPDVTWNPTGNSFQIPTLPPGGQKILHFGLTFPTPGTRTIQLHGSQKENDPTPPNNIVSTTIAVGPIPIATAGLDFGDAPDSYRTLKASNGPQHPLGPTGPVLGPLVDAESDGMPSPLATLEGPDDDGIVILDPVQAGQFVRVDVTVSRNCELDAFIDWSGNGSFEIVPGLGQPSELLDGLLENGPGMPLRSYPLIAGVNHLRFKTPDGVLPKSTFARFRISSAGLLGPGGVALDGEIEDYALEIVGTATPPTLKHRLNSNGLVTLFWDGTGHLQNAPTVIGPWSDGPAGNPIDIDPRVGMKIFRVVR